jgi:hypothetical protein
MVVIACGSFCSVPLLQEAKTVRSNVEKIKCFIKVETQK